ncbi:acyl-CoA dehydrogenase NM domain-like protein [Dichomitus squalens LYAD-421 SS1]|uniref:Acyl-CoA dehydrogenase NM domain-like protein n=1 Tax=Dichomitus squalens (strain LYAD-421) TaxID=732165 RepID=R7SUE2_DICSQ|nr:acyl-CoA dehydrogenase NM domain-like protein [Dichomitus squalens LYAD-421 SS1]EJF59538.1 acyl-CoA dehydrogenase NM domain-like protein [Dichomitus squalens LYAD-421 SS1]
MRIEEGFQQPPYPTEHPYLQDPVLPSLLRRILPHEIKKSVDSDLTRLGDVLIKDIRPLAPLVQPASVTQYDEFGRRVDILHTSEGWRRIEAFAIEEGYNAIAYELDYREYSRTVMFVRNMIMTGDCHAIMCPMGMTDGATRLIHLFGTEAMKRELLPHLLSRDPATAYLSGQWMTERPGGSDVSQTETRAVPTERVDGDLGDPYILDGLKWFSSAAEGNMAVGLARTGDVSQGSRGLSLFLIPLRMGQYSSPLSNGVFLHRLKNKVGTHGVPTAELELRGTRAWLLGPLNEGVRCIARMLNITRVHSTIHCVGSLQRCLSIARAYSTVRAVEGGKTLLKDVPMHVAGLVEITLLYKALVNLTFGAIGLLGRSECGLASVEEEARLRLLTPTIKGYAAHWATAGMEQAMGALGGLGYMEETGIGRLIRDAMVEKIWEGTISVCALDLTRAVSKEPKAVTYYIEWGRSLIQAAEARLHSPALRAVEILSASLERLPVHFGESTTNALLTTPLLNYFAAISCALYLLEHVTWSISVKDATSEVDLEAFRRWVEEGEIAHTHDQMTKAQEDYHRRIALNSKIVYGGDVLAAKL